MADNGWAYVRGHKPDSLKPHKKVNRVPLPQNSDPLPWEKGGKPLETRVLPPGSTPDRSATIVNSKIKEAFDLVKASFVSLTLSIDEYAKKLTDAKADLEKIRPVYQAMLSYCHPTLIDQQRIEDVREEVEEEAQVEKDVVPTPGSISEQQFIARLGGVPNDYTYRGCGEHRGLYNKGCTNCQVDASSSGRVKDIRLCVGKIMEVAWVHEEDEGTDSSSSESTPDCENCDVERCPQPAGSGVTAKNCPDYKPPSSSNSMSL